MGGIEFDWDAENIRHLKRHRVTPDEFEELMTSDFVYVEYQTHDDEERFKVPGMTAVGRILVGAWTPRRGKVRGVTAYAAGRAYQQLYRETHR